MKKIDLKQTKECRWLDSKGFSIVTVTCASCGRKYKEAIHTVRKKQALKYDIFVCEKCSIG